MKHNIRLADGKIQSINADFGTGIKDLSGKEIFENDLCFVYDHGIGVVRYDHYTGKFFIGNTVFDKYSSLDIKIIGSISYDFQCYKAYIKKDIILHILVDNIKDFIDINAIEVWKQINDTTFQKTTMTKFKKLIQKYEQEIIRVKDKLDKMCII